MSKYKVIRFYRDRSPCRRTLKRGLTRAEAEAHCSDPETSSSTCTTAAGRRRTKRLGAWFDGFDEE